jgi:hypothetical protein
MLQRVKDAVIMKSLLQGMPSALRVRHSVTMGLARLLVELRACSFNEIVLSSPVRSLPHSCYHRLIAGEGRQRL